MRALFALACFAAGVAFAQPVPPAPSVMQAPQAPTPPARIADAAWLQGYWAGTGMGGEAEDVWLPAKAGVMLGAFRLMKAGGKPAFYELFAIEEADDSLVFIVKHFNPDWVGWEEKDKAGKSLIPEQIELPVRGLEAERKGLQGIGAADGAPGAAVPSAAPQPEGAAR